MLVGGSCMLKESANGNKTKKKYTFFNLETLKSGENFKIKIFKNRDKWVKIQENYADSVSKINETSMVFEVYIAKKDSTIVGITNFNIGEDASLVLACKISGGSVLNGYADEKRLDEICSSNNGSVNRDLELIEFWSPTKYSYNVDSISLKDLTSKNKPIGNCKPWKIEKKIINQFIDNSTEISNNFKIR